MTDTTKLPELFICINTAGAVFGWGATRDGAIDAACESHGWDEADLFGACTVVAYRPARANQPAKGERDA